MSQPVILEKDTPVVFQGDEEDPIPRDRWGRPLIVPVDGGAPVAYTRATTLAKTLEDTHNLQQWAERQVLYGAGLRPDLATHATLLGPQAASGDKRAKQELNKLAESAKEVAGASVKRNMGTVLHKLSERVDRGEPLDDVPEVMKADLRAYWRATRDLEVVGIEEFVVNDPIRTAGTFDRLVRWRGRHVIADIKTGEVKYAGGSFAIQLAVYASGVRYDHTSVTRSPLPEDVDQDVALVIHLPQGEQRCDVYVLDLAAGREAIEHAVWVREYRKRKGLLHLVDAYEEAA